MFPIWKHLMILSGRCAPPFYMLGALVGRHGYAKVSLPGGCAWGPRPVNLHIEGLKSLGTQISMDKGYVIAQTSNGQVEGGEFSLAPSSVGATVNLLLASVMAKNTCTIHNAAREPDVVQLCQALQKMGAEIEGTGTTSLTVHGVKNLKELNLIMPRTELKPGLF